MANNSLLIKISLLGTEPLVWRKIVVNSDVPLEYLHNLIQTVMPWMNSHLHKFVCADKEYNYPFSDGDFDQIDDKDGYADVTLGDLVQNQGDKLTYIYDFGDMWEHRMVVEKVGAPLEDIDAKYMKGKNMAPPDDCGGVGGYARLKEIMADPSHPEYSDMAQWLGMDEDEEFDPEYIGAETDEINEAIWSI